MRALVSILLALAASHGAQATSVCVSNADQLASALAAAQTNGQDDIIRVVAGTYLLDSGLAFDSQEPDDLAISGGFDANCQVQTADFTVLDGQHLVRPLDIVNDHGDITVDRLQVRGGVTSALPGGAGLHASSISGDVSIERCEFIDNDSASYAGGVEADTLTGSLRITSNLVAANTSLYFGGIVLFQDSGVAYVVGNTVVLNHDLQGMAGGLTINGNATFALGNNILWNNNQDAGDDLHSDAEHLRINNDIGIIGGTVSVADLVVGEQDVDPGFEQCGPPCSGFGLAGTSPLVNAGNDSPYGGIGSLDLAGGPRRIGVHVDIGAFESDVLLRDGFGP
jgi:hypothetical protein